jgi:O-antigen ligase
MQIRMASSGEPRDVDRRRVRTCGDAIGDRVVTARSSGGIAHRLGASDVCVRAGVKGVNPRLRAAYDLVVDGIWLVLLVSIPVTSFPPLVDLAGGTPVAPLALIPLGALGASWLLPALLRGRRLPVLVAPLLLFAAVAVLSAGVGLGMGILPVRGTSVLGRELRALLTLALALGFYLCAALLPGERGRLRLALRAITIGGVLMLLWSTVQAGVVMTGGDSVPQTFVNLHRLIAPRDPVPDRLTGLAFEPSWLGDQLVTFYLPLWLAAVLTRTSAWSSGRRGWWVEAALGLWGILVLVLTRSRISYVSFALALAVLGMIAVWRGAGRILQRRTLGQGHARRGGVLLLRLATVLVFLGLCAGVTVGAAWAYSRVDPRMIRMFQTLDRLPEVRALHPNEVIYELANRVAFAERIVYWQAGFTTFAKHPLLGVGFGNAGFFMEANLPGYAFRLTEIRDLLSGTFAGLPNPKNLWVRLLAETGLVGFAAFLTWWLLIGASAIVLWRRGTGLQRLIGCAGLIGWLAAFGEGFSLDTFALPHIWILLGLVTHTLTLPTPESPADTQAPYPVMNHCR